MQEKLESEEALSSELTEVKKLNSLLNQK